MAASDTPAQLLKSILAETLPPAAVLVLSPDEVRRQRIAAKVLEDFSNKAKTKPEILASFHAKELTVAKLASLADQLSSLSLFSKVGFYQVLDLDAASADQQKRFSELVENLLSAKPTGNCLLIEGRKLAHTSPLFKKLQQKKLVLELPELKGSELTKWVKKELQNASVMGAGDDVVEALIAVGESSPDLIAHALQKLALFLGDEPATVERVERLFPERFSAREFDLLDALQSRNPAAAEGILSTLLQQGSNQFMILSLLGRTFSTYSQIESLRRSGKSSEQIRELMGLTPWLFSKQSSAAARYSEAALRKAREALLKADSSLKNRSLGTEAIFSDLLSQLRP